MAQLNTEIFTSGSSDFDSKSQDSCSGIMPLSMMDAEIRMQQYFNSSAFIVTTSGVYGPTELPPIFNKLRGSFCTHYPNDSFEDFVRACKPEDITAINNLKNPQMIADPESPQCWVIIDRENTVSGKNFTKTICALKALGLELLSERYFKEQSKYGWSWLATIEENISKGSARVGFFQGPDTMRVYFKDVNYMDDELGGRGMRIVQKSKS